MIDSISDYDQSQIYCAMEATGDYWLFLFSELTDKDFNISVFNPYQIKSFRGAYSNRKQKNDVIDSIIIADFLRFNGINQTCLPNDDLLALKNLFSDTFGDACSFEIKQLINQIIFLENQVDELDFKIKEMYSKLDSHLESVPGVGKKIAPIILAEIGDINNFSTTSKLTAFAGIDPSENQSGNKKSTDEKTSKRGSSYLRHAIYQAAFVASNNDPVMHDYYVKKRAESKYHYVALAGLERKLLGTIFHILKENRDYLPPKSS